MSSSKLSSAIVIVFMTFGLLQTCFGADMVNFACSNSGTFTAHSPYEVNLKHLISYLNFITPPTGFGMRSVGRDQNQRAYGLSLCRGDVSSSDCKACVSEASTYILNKCPSDKGAIIWYDICMFKYLDSDFLGQIDETNTFYLANWQSVSDPTTFNEKTKELLSRLANEASASPKMFAAGEMKLGGSDKLYGLTQCTRDLSSSDCNKCLVDAISELPDCCDGRQGGRVIGGSCNFRYEIYPFAGK